MNSSAPMSQADWQLLVSRNHAKAAELFGLPEAEQRRLGYFHTLHEICQQPWTWLRTCELMIESREELKQILKGMRSVTLTGSGSSQYAAECVQSMLRDGLPMRIESVSGGDLLMYGGKALPADRPGLLISLARSGDSPESRGAIELLLDTQPQIRHIVLTCNENGSITKAWQDPKKVHVITLPRETNDQSLVMTSSFTNLLLAARFVGMLDQHNEYRQLCAKLSNIAKDVIAANFDAFAQISKTSFERVVFLGSGSQFGGAREAALKMLEMTAGRVATMSETYLGFRHGPMSYVQDKTLLVCFLSSDPTLRAYELDLLQELDRKNLGLAKVVVGDKIPQRVVGEHDLAIECARLAELGDEDAATIDVVVAQLLGFFRCLEEELRPDSPSEDGIIQRVVERFPLHTPS
ncbi:MAG: SIS domain-containing protein [Acidobacteriota bacterium]|nr:SIS domain-containing protein [Acidobacteriota bacterium]